MNDEPLGHLPVRFGSLVPCRPFTAMLYEGWRRKFDNFKMGYLGREPHTVDVRPINGIKRASQKLSSEN